MAKTLELMAERMNEQLASGAPGAVQQLVEAQAEARCEASVYSMRMMRIHTAWHSFMNCGFEVSIVVAIVHGWKVQALLYTLFIVVLTSFYIRCGPLREQLKLAQEQCRALAERIGSVEAQRAAAVGGRAEQPAAGADVPRPQPTSQPSLSSMAWGAFKETFG